MCYEVRMFTASALRTFWKVAMSSSGCTVTPCGACALKLKSKRVWRRSVFHTFRIFEIL